MPADGSAYGTPPRRSACGAVIAGAGTPPNIPPGWYPGCASVAGACARMACEIPAARSLIAKSPMAACWPKPLAAFQTLDRDQVLSITKGQPPPKYLRKGPTRLRGAQGADLGPVRCQRPASTETAPAVISESAARTLAAIGPGTPSSYRLMSLYPAKPRIPGTRLR